MFSLPALSYGYNALEPFLDPLTVETHYTKHHQSYCHNLNQALETYPDLTALSIEAILTNIQALPAEISQTVINNGGGYYNHNLFWENIGPYQPKEPSGTLLGTLEKAFVTLADFQKLFTESATKLFGSGWTWLVEDRNGELKIINTANHDCPLSTGYQPLLVLDIWEHAYYLKYQNRRSEYINQWWGAVNWSVVAARLESLPA
ncbi:superoxide dismutase [Patescibacteria group bacterium]|nr:superoxide dismutase [Patescibacteria group bacterium]MBU1970694.1 superoxide dismutase [Patescibacteria group bacterium]